MAATKRSASSLNGVVKSMSREAERAQAAHERLVAREHKARERLQAVKARAGDGDAKCHTDSVLAAKQRLDESRRLRIEAAAKLREARKMVREEKQLAKEAERKQRARERALTAFLKKWDREYDLDMKRKQKNIELRRRELQRN